MRARTPRSGNAPPPDFRRTAFRGRGINAKRPSKPPPPILAGADEAPTREPRKVELVQRALPDPWSIR